MSTEVSTDFQLFVSTKPGGCLVMRRVQKLRINFCEIDCTVHKRRTFKKSLWVCACCSW